MQVFSQIEMPNLEYLILYGNLHVKANQCWRTGMQIHVQGTVEKISLIESSVLLSVKLYK